MSSKRQRPKNFSRSRQSGHEHWRSTSQTRVTIPEPDSQPIPPFRVVRRIEGEQVTDIQEKLAKTIGCIPGVQLRVGEDQMSPAVTLLRSNESLVPEETPIVDDEAGLDEFLSSRIPILGGTATCSVADIRPFAGARERLMKANFDRRVEPIAAERGQIVAVVSELYGWRPVKLEPKDYHVGLVYFPMTTPKDVVDEISHATAAAIGGELTLTGPEYHIG